MKDYLAEDFVMGKFAAEAGHGVILSSYVIEHHIGKLNACAECRTSLRWARSTRRSRPAGYVGQLFTMPLPLAVLVCALSPAWWPVLPVALCGARRLRPTRSQCVCCARESTGSCCRIEDVMGFFFWIAGFFGNTISWRGRRYRLFADGRFELTSLSI